MDDGFFTRMAKKGYLGTGPLIDANKYGSYNPFRSAEEAGGNVTLSPEQMGMRAPGAAEAAQQQKQAPASNVRSKAQSELNERLLNQGYSPQQIMEMERQQQAAPNQPK